MSDCIYGAFGQALEVRGLGSPKTKRIRTQNLRPPFTNIPLQQGRIPRSTRLFAMGHAILPVSPKNRYLSELVPQILPRGIGHIDTT